jgi:hypothetical protein
MVGPPAVADHFLPKAGLRIGSAGASYLTPYVKPGPMQSAVTKAAGVG